jgi:hypothetical protein
LSDEVIFFPVSLNCKCAALDHGKYRSLRLYSSSPPAPGRSIDPRLPVNGKDIVNQARLILKGRDVPATGFDQMLDPISSVDAITVVLVSMVCSADTPASDLNQMDIVDDDGSDTDHTALTHAKRKAFRLYIPISSPIRPLSPSLLSRPSCQFRYQTDKISACRGRDHKEEPTGYATWTLPGSYGARSSTCRSRAVCHSITALSILWL